MITSFPSALITAAVLNQLGSHPVPTDRDDRKVTSSHRLPAGEAEVSPSPLSPDTQVTDGSTAELGSDDSSRAFPERNDDSPGRVNAVHDPKVTIANRPASSSASVGAGEGPATPVTIAGSDKKAAFKMGGRSTQAAAAGASPASREDRASNRGRRITETEEAVENMTRRLFEMGISEHEKSVPSGDKGEDGHGQMSRSRLPYISPGSGDKNSRVTGARSRLVDPSSLEAVGDSCVGAVKTKATIVAGKRSPVPKSAAIEAVLAPESVVKELRDGERRQITADKGKRSPNSFRIDERSKASAGSPAVRLDFGLVLKPTSGDDEVDAKSNISHVSPRKVERVMQLDLEGINPSGEISLGSSGPTESSVTVSHPFVLPGKACRSSSGRRGTPETAAAAVVDDLHSPVTYLPSDIQVEGYKEESGSSIVGTGGSIVGACRSGEEGRQRQQETGGDGGSRDIGALLRPDGEYEDAISKLVDAAQHVARLYRGLTEATALAAARNTAVGTGSLAFPESHRFGPTSGKIFCSAKDGVLGLRQRITVASNHGVLFVSCKGSLSCASHVVSPSLG